jgi:hypothetical protein
VLPVSVRLVPLSSVDADLATLDLGARDSDAGPEDEEIDLVLGGAVAHLDGLADDGVVRQGLDEQFPDGTLRFVARTEVRLFWYRACHGCSPRFRLSHILAA